MLQALTRQQDKQNERNQIGDAVPVHGQWPQRQGHRIELGMGQHALDCRTSSTPDHECLYLGNLYFLSILKVITSVVILQI